MNAKTEFDDTILMAYADGELDAATRAAVERALLANPEVAARVAEHAALRSRVRSAYEPMLKEPVPEQWLRQLQAEPVAAQPASVIPLERNRSQAKAARRWSWPEWGAIAASIVVGLVIGQQFLQPAGPMGVRDGMLVAQGPLAAALSDQLAAAQAGAGAVEVGISFRNRAGDYCRTFQLAAGGAGFACREGEEWRVKILSDSERGAAGPGNYRLAATPLPAAVLSAVESAIDGEPLDADGEMAARKAGWR